MEDKNGHVCLIGKGLKVQEQEYWEQLRDAQGHNPETDSGFTGLFTRAWNLTTLGKAALSRKESDYKRVAANLCQRRNRS